MKLISAAVQMVSTDRVAENLSVAAALVADAAKQDAQLVVLPENFGFMGRSDADRLAHAEPDKPESDSQTPMQYFLQRTAREHAVWLVGGTIPLQLPGQQRVSSAALVYGPEGMRRARYDKIHLFDVDVPGAQGHYRESKSTLAGEQPVIASTEFGGLGLATCYDLRFPELFRAMAGPELSVIAIGSAFTVTTGEAHWETLVRARAIENQTAVVAASQGGAHTGGRDTYGHSMIVDAWGRILVQHARGAAVIVAEIDLDAQRTLRDSFPVLAHRRAHLTGNKQA